jgi:hypothetical protein
MGWQQRARMREEGEAEMAHPSGLARQLGIEDVGADLPPRESRRQIDRSLGDELDVSAKLNVKVDAPAGTEVKANGGGMFEKNVSVDRQIGSQNLAM